VYYLICSELSNGVALIGMMSSVWLHSSNSPWRRLCRGSLLLPHCFLVPSLKSTSCTHVTSGRHCTYPLCPQGRCDPVAVFK